MKADAALIASQGLFYCVPWIRQAEARIAKLEAELQRIAGREPLAREMVAAGFHNTSLAIDLAGMARLGLEK